MMRDPVFTQTMQLGIVVRNPEGKMRKYVGESGIGPWKIYEFNGDSAHHLQERGQQVNRSWRLAVVWVGRLQWELSQPLGNQGICRRFLAEKGGGLTPHHMDGKNLTGLPARASMCRLQISVPPLDDSRVDSLSHPRDRLKVKLITCDLNQHKCTISIETASHFS